MGSLILNRQLFWQLYHKAFDAYGPTTQATVNALNADLDKFETETRLHGVSQYSYTLATEYHETGINDNHFVPVKEGRNRAGSKGRKNQDRYWLSGFYGRGKVQTTWKEKYLAIGELLGVGDKFVKDPDLLLTDNWAYEAMVAGMSHGIYRRDKHGPFSLDRMLHGDTATVHQYEEAREIINGDKAKNGLLIAGYALKFEHILMASKVSAADNTGDEDMDTAGTGSVSAGGPAPSANGDSLSTEGEQPPTIIDSPTDVTSAATLWQRMTGWTEKITIFRNLRDSLPDMPKISPGSWLMTIWTKFWGWVLMAIGIIMQNPWLILPGLVLVIVAIWYFSKSKDRATSRISPPAQAQEQKVVVQT